MARWEAFCNFFSWFLHERYLFVFKAPKTTSQLLLVVHSMMKALISELVIERKKRDERAQANAR